MSKEKLLVLNNRGEWEPAGFVLAIYGRGRRREQNTGEPSATAVVMDLLEGIVSGLGKIGESQAAYFGPGGVNAIISRLGSLKDAGEKGLGLSTVKQIDKMRLSGTRDMDFSTAKPVVGSVARKSGEEWRALMSSWKDNKRERNEVVRDMSCFELGDKHGVVTVDRLSRRGDFEYPDRVRVAIRVLDGRQWEAFLDDPRTVENVRGYGADSEGYQFFEYQTQSGLVPTDGGRSSGR